MALVGASSLAAVGCGGDDDTPSTAAKGSETTAAAPEATSKAPDGLPTLEALYKGGEKSPPASGPKPQKGKSIWWISCGMSVPDCSVPAKAAQEAAKAIGWDFKIADGALNVNNGNEKAVRQALAADPDAMIIHAADCPTINAPLAEAKKRKIPVIGVEALDCSDPPKNGEDLLPYDNPYTDEIKGNVDFFKVWGQVSAAYLIHKSDAKAQIILSHGTEATHETVNAGFRETFDQCGGCKVLEEASFANPDLTPDGAYVQRLRSVLTKNPTANAAYFPFDVNFLVGGAQAAKSANPDMLVTGGSGSAASFDLVRQGLIDGVTAHDTQWMGWGALDNVNRILNGQEPVPQGIGFIAVDKDHNLPPKGELYKSTVDFRSVYRKSWGAK
ncbi:substrate-binding domain-containing protein [Patulibacter sp. NPDC049589]|uniref:sugar ABC transporter substrate-binding protein n=1 Tax=Patulibacter sp. NPDC049589 TaxID=3154731 RepID=UPI003413F6A5